MRFSWILALLIANKLCLHSRIGWYLPENWAKLNGRRRILLPLKTSWLLFQVVILNRPGKKIIHLETSKKKKFLAIWGTKILVPQSSWFKVQLMVLLIRLDVLVEICHKKNRIFPDSLCHFCLCNWCSLLFWSFGTVPLLCNNSL